MTAPRFFVPSFISINYRFLFKTDLPTCYKCVNSQSINVLRERGPWMSTGLFWYLRGQHKSKKGLGYMIIPVPSMALVFHGKAVIQNLPFNNIAELMIIRWDYHYQWYIECHNHPHLDINRWWPTNNAHTLTVYVGIDNDDSPHLWWAMGFVPICELQKESNNWL